MWFLLHYNMDITTILMLLLLMVTLELSTHTITWTDVTTIYVRICSCYSDSRARIGGVCLSSHLGASVSSAQDGTAWHRVMV